MSPLQRITPHTEQIQPAFFATTSWIRAQRVASLALVALGLIASTLAPIAAGIVTGAVTPLILSASVLFGASLIQQSMGDAPGCERGKITRAVAGAFIMLFPIFGWIPGALLWHESYLLNKQVRAL